MHHADSDCAARHVLSYYAPTQRNVQALVALAGAGGWSGSRLWRATSAAGPDFCLRRWPPEHPPPERLLFIHTVLCKVAAELPVVAAPLRTADGRTFVEHAGHQWELTAWLPGRADYRERPSRTRLRAALQALARFHNEAARIEIRRGTPQTLVERQQQLDWLRRGGRCAIDQALLQSLGNELDPRAGRLWSLVRPQLLGASLESALQQLPELGLQPAIRDVHQDHVLFTGDEVTGLVDFGALRIDTPLADVARLVGSLAGNDRAAQAAALAAYGELRPLSDVDFVWINRLDLSGRLLGAVNWLKWLYLERRDMGPIAPIARRIDELSQWLSGRGSGVNCDRIEQN